MVKSLYFTKYKSGILELVFTFDSKKFSECSLITYNKLLYKDLSKEKDIVFEFPQEIYQENTLRNYIQYENTNKDQFVVIFIPQEMLIGEKDPSEVIEFETEWKPL